MRIISGTSKGKRLYEPKDLLTRPLKDLTKESIFNIICHSNKFNVALEDANILDLFSGTGSFGLECLSRGSKHVTFVENYKKILPILKKNIIGLNYEKNSKIIEMDINNSLSFKVFKDQFNIIFLDPPYKEKKLFQMVENIVQFNLLKDEGVVIIHRHKKEIDKFPKRLKIIEDKLYGISRVFFGSYI
jgi:16S rRNA (guanine966-N2)-methyltransferase